jgi:hypothetical protein
MIVRASDQSKNAYCEAALAEYMDGGGICPGNHIIGYYRGWYGIDERNFQDPNLTRRAEEMMDRRDVDVGYSRAWNCYVFRQ